MFHYFNKLRSVSIFVVILLTFVSQVFADHFKFSVPSTTRFMFFYGDVFNIDGKTSEPGDEIAVFDQQGTMCGHFVVTNPGYFNLPVYGDESYSPEDEGASIIEDLIFKVWDVSTEMEISLDNSMFIQKSVFGKVSIDTIPPKFLGGLEVRGMGIDAYVISADPAIESIYPEYAYTIGGGNLEITGTNFQNVTVLFDHSVLSQVMASETKISFPIPPHKEGTIEIIVKNQSGITATTFLTYISMISDIPDQTINIGEQFSPIVLNDFVNDINNSVPAVSWGTSGETDLKVIIQDQVANIIAPDNNWFGKETIAFIAQDPNGLTSIDTAMFTVIDNIKPVIDKLSIDQATWYWSANEICTFRFAIDQSPTWEASGTFLSITQTTIYHLEGTWYLHLQAKDRAGNLSDILTDEITLEKPTVYFSTGSSESSESITYVQLQLELSRIIEHDVTVDYRFESSVAKLDKDFVLPDDLTVTIPSGHLTGVIEFTVIDDPVTESEEDISFELQSAKNAELTWKKFHTYSILNNDYPGISILPQTASISLTENTQVQAFSIVLNTQPKYNVDIHITHPRLVIVPEIVSFIPDEWYVHQPITIIAEDTPFYEGNSHHALGFDVNSPDDQYANIFIPVIQTTVIDDEPPPKPPEVQCHNGPIKSYNPRWDWISGGGTNHYRYRLDNDYLEIGAIETNKTTFQSSSNLSQGEHTLYVQEYNDHSKQWSESGSCTVQIDTGHPCAAIESVSTIDPISKQLTITYTWDDIYQGENCGNMNSGSGVEKVELWVARPEYSQYEWVTSDVGLLDGAFSYTVSQEGRYRFLVRAADRAENYEFFDIPSPDDVRDGECIYSDQFAGYAILAVGAISEKEGLDSHTLTADNIYQHLIHRKFGIQHDLTDPLDHIKYFNPHRNTHTGVDLIENSYSLSLKQAIENWAPTKMNQLSGPLYIILLDHGNPNTFYLSDSSESLSSDELNQWITHLENKLTIPQDIIIIIDTCYSGSFIEQLSLGASSQSTRVIITSAAENESSFRGPMAPEINPIRVGAFFANNLFNELAKGKRLSDSFKSATQATERLTSRNMPVILAPYFDTAVQHPLLDDNADGEGHNEIIREGFDGFHAQNIYLGFGNENHSTIISSGYEPESHLTMNQAQVVFNVRVSAPERTESVWMEIRKPDVALPSAVNPFSQKELDLISIFMTFNPAKNLYEVAYDKFYQAGKYTIFFYVKDCSGVISGSDQTIIFKNRANNSPPETFGLIAPDNHTDSEFTEVILEWEPARDFESILYAAWLSTDPGFEQTATLKKEYLVDPMSLIKLPDQWDARHIYWKIIATDIYGAQTESPVWEFSTNNQNPGTQPILYFQIYDEKTYRPIPQAMIEIISENAKMHLEMNQNGRMITKLNTISDRYTITVKADNYHPYQEIIQLQDRHEITLTYGLLSKIQMGDINNNGEVDLGDVILCLQLLCGFSELQYESMALIEEGVSLRDAIFIFREIAEVSVME